MCYLLVRVGFDSMVPTASKARTRLAESKARQTRDHKARETEDLKIARRSGLYAATSKLNRDTLLYKSWL